MTIPKIQVVEGDITQIPADALMTAINSERMWYGGIDRAIQRVAGDMYHSQANKISCLNNLQTIIAKGTGKHRGQFRDVVFVVDDVISSLNKVIYNGLEAANTQGYESLLIPTIRMGVASNIMENTPEEAIEEMINGLNNFKDKYSTKTNLSDIKIVVYKNPELVKNIIQAIKK